MDLDDLAVFLAVAEEGSVTGAARRLGRVQSNVTTRLRMLEERLEARLFRRHRRGMTLTRAGERLVPVAREARSLPEAARRAVREPAEPEGLLAIGALETATAIRLPAVLRRYLHRHRQVELRLVTGTTAELIDQVAAGRLQAALVADPGEIPELAARPVWSEAMKLATAPEWREPFPARSEPPALVVFRRGCSYRVVLERFFASAGHPRPRVLELGTLDGIVGCVGAGLGITLLPEGALAAAAAEGRVSLHPPPAGSARIDTVLIRRADEPMSAALAAFLACATEPLEATIRPVAPSESTAA